jgi:tRNA-dihydrouridine synthase
MYKGDADWTYIEKVKNNPRMYIPVFANGDINTPEKAQQIKNLLSRSTRAYNRRSIRATTQRRTTSQRKRSHPSS